MFGYAKHFANDSFPNSQDVMSSNEIPFSFEICSSSSIQPPKDRRDNAVWGCMRGSIVSFNVLLNSEQNSLVVVRTLKRATPFILSIEGIVSYTAARFDMEVRL